jgi:phosphoglycerate dehydrogenase-like enzyme
MKILFCGKTFPHSQEMLTKLMPEEEILSCPASEVAEKGLDVDVLIPLMHRLEPDLIRHTRARLIHQWGVGLEGVDIPLATERGILVCNVPANVTPNADSTAEHALFLMLGLARRIHSCSRSFHEGRWGSPLGLALCGCNALIVGLGNVGSSLARKLVALGMNVAGIRRTPDTETQHALGLTALGDLSQLHELAGGADFVVSGITLTALTRGIFDSGLFKAMKPDAYFVNVSRGPVVNEQDLMDALKAGTIAGAGLDVYAVEPLPADHPFLSMPNVFATPHVGGTTQQNSIGIGRIVEENLRLFKQGKPPLYRVNAAGLAGTR